MENECDQVSIEDKTKIKKAVKFGMIAVGLSLISVVLYFIQTGLSLVWLENQVAPMQLFITFMALGAIDFALLIASTILLYIFWVKLYKASNPFSSGYQKFLLFTMVLFGVYILIQNVIWPVIMGGLYFGWMMGNVNYGFISGSNAFMTIILVSIFAITIAFPLLPLASGKEKKTLTIVAIVYVSGMAPLHQLALYSIENATVGYILTLVVYLPLLLGVYITFFYCYRKIYKALPEREISKKWRTEPKTSNSGAGRLLGRYLKFIGPNLYRSLIPIAMIGILYGAFIGFTTDDPFENIGRFDPEDILDMFSELDDEPGVSIHSMSDELQEGEEIAYTIEAGNKVDSISAQIFWTDEPDLIRRENQPDTFELELHGDQVVSDTGSNSHGSEGDVFVRMGDVGDTTDFEVVVRLTEAGDQNMKNGPGIIVWTDNSNEFELIVWVTYLSTEKEP